MEMQSRDTVPEQGEEGGVRLFPPKCSKGGRCRIRTRTVRNSSGSGKDFVQIAVTRTVCLKCKTIYKVKKVEL